MHPTQESFDLPAAVDVRHPHSPPPVAGPATSEPEANGEAEAPCPEPAHARRRSLAGRLLRWAAAGLLVLLLLGAVGAAYARLRYPGFAKGMYRQLRTASRRENTNLFFCISYWIDFMERLRPGPVKGAFVFPEDPADGSDYERGRQAFHRGEFGRAVKLIGGDIEGRGETEAKLFWLAMSSMREAEAANCLAALRGGLAGVGPAPCCDGLCSLPLPAPHGSPASAGKAASLFQRLLDRYDAENPLYRWLLTFNAMTAGSYPEGVPARYRLNNAFEERFLSPTSAGTPGAAGGVVLKDRARELGVDTMNTGRGVSVEDFDGDGDLDIVTAGGFETLTYYENLGGTRFVERTAASGLGGVRQPFVTTAADYDNDGDVDLFIACPFGNYRLFRNRGAGTFDDVTATSGLLDGLPAGHVCATWIAAWGDVNGDGLLDLFVAQWGMELPFVREFLARPRSDSKLFLNVGGRFVDATGRYGLGPIVRDQYFIGAAFGDYDRDGFPDLYLSSPLRGGTSVLLHNEAGRAFRATDLIYREEGGFSAAFVDVDQDGRLDLFHAGFADAKTSTEMAVFGIGLDTYQSGHSTIFRQMPDGRFRERRDTFDLPMSTMGSSFGDLNNDGAIDFYLGTGTPEPWFILPNLLYMGRLDGDRPTGMTVNATMHHGAGTIQKGHGIVFFDFDDDGDQDIYSSLGGMWPGDGWPNQLFVNEGKPSNAWTKVRLRGTRTNRLGVGATVRVVGRRAGGGTLTRYYHMDQKTGFGSAPYVAHVGLLDARSVERIDVFWPVSRRWESYAGRLAVTNLLTEGEGTPSPAPEAP